MEKVALGVANDLQAEFWTVSSKTGGYNYTNVIENILISYEY